MADQRCLPQPVESSPGFWLARREIISLQRPLISLDQRADVLPSPIQPLNVSSCPRLTLTYALTARR